VKRNALKEKWTSLTDEEKIPYQKKQRDHMAKQSLMQECITDPLQKQKGGNYVRSYASLAKVTAPTIIFFYSNLPMDQQTE
jgi:hypothetical protein